MMYGRLAADRAVAEAWLDAKLVELASDAAREWVVVHSGISTRTFPERVEFADNDPRYAARIFAVLKHAVDTKVGEKCIAQDTEARSWVYLEYRLTNDAGERVRIWHRIA